MNLAVHQFLLFVQDRFQFYILEHFFLRAEIEIFKGVKSILDIGLTLEVLETLGVGVYTIGEDDKFPAFYVRDSGFSSPGGAIDIKR